jgi:hypothetical protein
MTEKLPGWEPGSDAVFAKCGANPVGPGGILCPSCRAAIEAANARLVSIAGVACYRPGRRPHLFYQLRACRRRKGEPKGFGWSLKKSSTGRT